MTVLDSVLIEEYHRKERMKEAFLCEIANLPKGCLSKKIIKGKEYFYREYKENGKKVSKYVPLKDVESVRKQIENRKALQKGLKEIEGDQRKIKKAVGDFVG